MTDRALQRVRLRHAVRGGQGLARDTAQPRADHAKDVHGQPDSVRSHPHPLGAEPARRAGSACRRWRRRSPGSSRPACPPRTPSTRTPRCRYTSAGRLCCSACTRRTRPTDDGPGRLSTRPMVIDPEVDPAAGTGHRREGHQHRRGRREELRVRPRVHPRPRPRLIDERRASPPEGTCPPQAPAAVWACMAHACSRAPRIAGPPALDLDDHGRRPDRRPAHIAATPIPPPRRCSS